ncbi:MAG TPA: hypothetical protein V6D03_10950 [Candidatus Caenarcaniphilales bacterium]
MQAQDEKQWSLPVNTYSAVADVWVLVVDDERGTRELLRAILEPSEAKVTAVASAQRAIALLQQIRSTVLVSHRGCQN